MHLAQIRAVGCSVALAAGIAFSSAASADESLVSSNPAPGVTLNKAPETMRLNFSGPIQTRGSAVAVKSPDGTIITRKPTISGSVMSARLSAHENGVYHVTWSATSSDGHPMKGAYDFTMQGQRDGTNGSGGQAAALNAPKNSTVTGPNSPTTHEPGDNEPFLIVGSTAVVTAGLVGAWFVARRRVHDDPQ